MDTYGKLKVEQQSNEIVKKGLEAEKDPEDGPVRLLVRPGDLTKYYREKMSVIQKDLKELNRLLVDSDSIPPLSHFGYNYFSLRDSIQFIDNANVSSNYILGFGDEVVISIWGQAEQHERKILDRDGTIFIDNVGLLYLGGKNQSQAKEYVLNRFTSIYATLKSDPQLSFLEFSVGKTKNINISVSGHVLYPGNYVVNPSTSIPNILILAGGISEIGTLRNVFLQRNGVIVDTLDLYPLITGIGLIDQIPIFDSDIIVVPPRGNFVALTGNILNPSYFEIIETDNISTLIKYAGGEKTNGNNQVIIARSQSSNLFVSKSDFSKTELINGDSLIIPINYDPIKSISISVTNRSNIEMPWIKNLTFQQILNILSVDFNNVRDAELIRRDRIKNQYQPIPFDLANSNEILFFPNDHISIHLFEDFTLSRMVIVDGEVNSPGTYPLIQDQETINSIISRAGGLQKTTNINNVVVKRDTLIFGSSNGEMTLTPGDTIIANPSLGTVKVEGEVHNPGNFEWRANASAKNYLSFAGGLTAYGDKKHIVYITPYGEATRINQKSNESILPGSIIRVSEKPISEQNYFPDRIQQVSSLITSLVSIAILANTTTK
tara:strand:+ start:6 stop:1820 length:1815 start_codon:yes stop_codon:yes gene_type:complete